MRRLVFLHVAFRHILRERQRDISSREAATIYVSPVRCTLQIQNRAHENCQGDRSTTKR